MKDSSVSKDAPELLSSALRQLALLDKYHSTGVREAAARLAAKVAPIYEFLGWTWYEEHTPTKNELYQMLLHLYQEVETGASVSSGGLTVKRGWTDEGDDGHPIEHVTLSFSIEEDWYAEDNG